METKVFLMKCSKSHATFGVRIQKMEDCDWYRTWAFPIDEQRAKKEGFDNETVHGNLNYLANYPGCPYCGDKNFVCCGSCHKFSCYNGQESLDCPWCGQHMTNITVAEDKFEVSGGDI